MVIGEITTDKAIFVLNKIDLLPEKDRSSRIQSIETGLRKTLSKTRFKNAPIVSLCLANNRRSLSRRRSEVEASKMPIRPVSE